MDSRSRAVMPTVVRCLYLEDVNRSVLFFLCVLVLLSAKQTWECQPRWVHYTDFRERRDLIHSFHYIYCVRWSAPTAQKPLLQVSVAARFTIKINKNKPPVSSPSSALLP